MALAGQSLGAWTDPAILDTRSCHGPASYKMHANLQPRLTTMPATSDDCTWVVDVSVCILPLFQHEWQTHTFRVHRRPALLPWRLSSVFGSKVVLEVKPTFTKVDFPPPLGP